MPSIHLTRHAHPDRLAAGYIYHELPGPPLTERGLVEARELGEYFLRVGVRTVLSSPFDRCLHTARIAAEIAGAQVQVDPALGEWQPGEKAEDVRKRLWPVFEQARQTSQKDGPVALVLHGGPIGVLLEALGMDRTALLRQHTYDYGNPLPPAGVWVVEKDGGEASWNLSLAFTPSSATPIQAVNIYPSSKN